MKAIIYARVSTTRQAEEGVSIESQIDAGWRKAAELGAEVVKVFRDEGVSARTDRRPAFLNAIDYCALGGVRFFITWSTSRFARNRVDAGSRKQELKKCGTKVVYVSSDIDGDTDDGWLLESMSEMIDEQYSRQVAKDTKRSMIANARAGFFNGGRVPYGYRAEPDGKRKRLVIFEEEARVVRRIFEMYTEGAGTKLIAMTLNREGVLRSSGRWSKNNVRSMLGNLVYGGNVVFGRVDNAGYARPREEWIVTPSHPPIIPPDEIERIVLRLEDQAGKNVGGSPRSNFVFTGLLKCGRCRHLMQTESGTGRNGKLYHYYNCRSFQNGTGCTSRRIPAYEFDAWLTGEIADRILSVDRVKRMIEDVEELVRTSERRFVAANKAIDRQIADAESRRAKLVGVLEITGKDTPNLSDFGRRLDELRREIWGLQEDKRRLVAARETPRKPTAVDVKVMTEFLRDLLTDPDDDPARLREFFSGIVKEAVMLDEDVEVTYYPERIIDSSPAMFRGAGRWLPDRLALRTVRIAIGLPAQWGRAA